MKNISKSHDIVNILQNIVIMLVISLFMVFCVPTSVTTIAYANEYHDVDVHSESEIRSYYENIKSDLEYDGDTYSSAPILPSYEGKLSTGELKRGLSYLNFIRYISGVKEYSLDTKLTSRAQKAASLMAVTGKCEHGITEIPNGFTTTEWSTCNIVLGNSDICWVPRSNNNLMVMIKGLINDTKTITGHRVDLTKYYNGGTVGFGSVNSYGVVYTDQDKTSFAGNGLVWPAREQPIQCFDTGCLWSCIMPDNCGLGDDVTVKITDNDGMTETLTSGDGKVEIGTSKVKSITFTPSVSSVSNGDKYHIAISNTNGNNVIEYDVHFFDLNKSQDSINDITYNSNEGTYCNVPVEKRESFANEIKSNATSHPSLEVFYQGKELTEGTDYVFDNDAVSIESSGSTDDYVKISVSLKGIGKYHGTMKTKIGKIPNIFTEKNSEINISLCTVMLPSSAYNYTGKAISPFLTVTYGDKTLASGTDYTVTYSNNIDAGTATVRIDGIGNYTGSITRTFSILKANISSAQVSGIDSSYTETGSAICPVPSLTFNGMTLTDSDYSVSYSNNASVGTATVTIAGKGNFTGTRDVTFAIIAKPVEKIDMSTASVKIINADSDGNVFSYTGEKISVKYEVTVNGTELGSGCYSVRMMKGTGNEATKINSSDVVEPGKYTLVVNGSSWAHSKDSSIPIYTGSISVEFEIVNNGNNNENLNQNQNSNENKNENSNGNLNVNENINENDNGSNVNDNNGGAEHKQNVNENSNNQHGLVPFSDNDNDNINDNGNSELENSNGNENSGSGNSNINGNENNNNTSIGPSPTDPIIPVDPPSCIFNIGDKFTVGSGSNKAIYRVLSFDNAGRNGTVMLVSSLAIKSKTINVPSSVTKSNCTFDVVSIGKKAFIKAKKATKVTIGANVKTLSSNVCEGNKKIKTLTIKTKKLTKKSVKKSLKASKVKTVKINVGSKKDNKKYVNKYKKIFTKKNVGIKVTVK